VGKPPNFTFHGNCNKKLFKKVSIFSLCPIELQERKNF